MLNNFDVSIENTLVIAIYNNKIIEQIECGTKLVAGQVAKTLKRDLPWQYNLKIN